MLQEDLQPDTVTCTKHVKRVKLEEDSDRTKDQSNLCPEENKKKKKMRINKKKK